MATSGAAISPAPPSPSRYPLALAYGSVAFLAGLFWTSAGLPTTSLLALAVVVSLVLLPAGRWQLALLVLACGAAAVLGAWRYEATRYHDGPDKIAHYIGRSAVLVAMVDGEPQPGGHGENFQVNVESAQISGRPRHAGGQVLVHYTGAQHVEYGDRLTLTGRLLQPFSAPGFDYRAYLARRGVYATIDFPLLRIDARGVGNPIQGFALHLRDTLRHTIDAMLPHDEAALLIGILLGAPTKSLGTLTALFVSTGMIHIVAISGLKVALVAGVLSGVCARLPARIRWAPALAGVCLYTLMSGATPSGLRSALMWALALLALQFGRRSYVWVSLAVVAALMAWWEPQLPWDTGFELSVVGTAGIIAFTPWFEQRLHRLPLLLRESVAVTLAAQVATVLITAGGFGQVSFIGPVANGLLLPLLGPIMALGGAAALIASAVSPLAHPMGWIVYPLLALFIGVVKLLAHVPAASVPTPALPAFVALGYYLLLGVLALRRQPSLPSSMLHTFRIVVLWRATPRGLLAGCIVGGLTATVALVQPAARAQLTIAGVGGGTVEMWQLPDGQLAFIDGGRDPAALQALLGEHQAFWRRDLAVAMVTEPDIGHLAGMSGLSTTYSIHRELDPGAVYPSAAYAHWRAELRNGGVTVTPVRTGQRIDFGNGTVVDVLLPTSLSLDAVPAPVAYRLRIGRLAVLVLNREALSADLSSLRADGACFDTVVLPARADPTAAAALVQALHPRLIILPQAQRPAAPLVAAQLGALPPGTNVWTAAEGAQRVFDARDGRCP